MAQRRQQADSGFHEGELTAQRRAGVEAKAARLSRVLQPVDLHSGIGAFLGDQTFAALTGRDAFRHLWVSPLTGQPGFLHVTSPTTLEVTIHTSPGDPLCGLPVGQRVGMVAVDFTARRRVRVNGTLVQSDAERLVIEVEQAFGNCPQHIQPRILTPQRFGESEVADVRYDVTLGPEDVELIQGADTFFLGTTNPKRGSDASHRGGPAGFVQVDGNQVWWPDYPGNNMFNSFGNLEVNPEAAVLFTDFHNGSTLQLSGTAEVEWDEPRQLGANERTGRRAVFTVQRVVAGHLLSVRQTHHGPDVESPT